MGSEFGSATDPETNLSLPPKKAKIAEHVSFTMKSDFDALVYSMIQWGIRYTSNSACSFYS